MNRDTFQTSERPGVLILVSSLRFGGAEKHAVALTNELDAAALRVQLCYIKEDAHLAAELAPERNREAVTLGVRGKFSLRAARRLAKLIDDRAIDVVVCTNGYPLWYAVLAQRWTRRRIRLVEVLHTTIVNTAKSTAIMWLNRLTFRRCDLLVYVSTGQQRHWRARGMRAKRERVIHNGVDVERFTDRYTAQQKAQARAEYGFGPQDYVIGICAALRPEKAHGDLLLALKALRASGVDAKLLIIGDGRERMRIEQQIDALALRGAAVITGYRPDVRPYVAACDVMALSSHAIETFSIAALESMALGKPLVLTRIGGAEEQVVQGLNGYLYEPGDIDALTDHLRTLADAELRRRMGAEAARLVRERFTTHQMASAFEGELLRLAGAQRPPTEPRTVTRAASAVTD